MASEPVPLGNEAWDDTALIRAWDDAQRRYKEMHGDKDWRTHADEGGQGEGDGNAHSEEDEEGVADEQVAKRTRDDAELHGEREEGEVDAHEPDTKRARMGDVTAVAPPAPRTASPELEAMLHAYYYAGYYAGFYDAQAGGRNEGH